MTEKEEYQVVQRNPDHTFKGIIAGMSHNAGTWDSNHTLRDALVSAREMRGIDPAHIYTVEYILSTDTIDEAAERAKLGLPA